MQKIKICNWKWLSCFSIVSATFFWWCSHSFQESVRTIFGVCTQKKYIQNWIFLFLFIFIVFFSMRTQFMQFRVANAYRSMLLLSVICSCLIEKRVIFSEQISNWISTHTHSHNHMHLNIFMFSDSMESPKNNGQKFITCNTWQWFNRV